MIETRRLLLLLLPSSRSNSFPWKYPKQVSQEARDEEGAKRGKILCREEIGCQNIPTLLFFLLDSLDLSLHQNTLHQKILRGAEE